MNDIDQVVFAFALAAISFVLGMGVQHAEGEPIILHVPQPVEHRVVSTSTDCTETIIWCRAKARLAKVEAKK